MSHPSVALLGQRVDALGLSSCTDKLQAIQSLRFPRFLKQLEHYLGLTGWLRQFIANYAQLAAPLQARKARLNSELQAAKYTGIHRKKQASQLKILDITQSEQQSFQSLQLAFKKLNILFRFDPEQKLFVDLDASRHGMGAMAYHSSKDPPSQKSVKPIMFLSRLLKAGECNYWPIELEIACCCWAVSKIRHD